jgi:hypothetical protein
MTTWHEPWRALVALALLPICLGGCQQESGGPTGVAVEAQGSMNGAAGKMPAYYDGRLVTINIFEVPGEAAILAHNKSVNEIYASNDLDEEQEFIAVIDAIQGDGFNPLWHQNLYSFNAGFAPHQFTSDEEVLDAAATGEITLTPTDEVYRCSVVGPKHK